MQSDLPTFVPSDLAGLTPKHVIIIMTIHSFLICRGSVGIHVIRMLIGFGIFSCKKEGAEAPSPGDKWTIVPTGFEANKFKEIEDIPFVEELDIDHFVKITKLSTPYRN